MSRDLIVKNLVTSDNLMKTVKSGADEGKKGNCVHGAQTREIRSQASSLSPHQLQENNKITHALRVYLDKIYRLYSSKV